MTVSGSVPRGQTQALGGILSCSLTYETFLPGVQNLPSGFFPFGFSLSFSRIAKGAITQNHKTTKINASLANPSTGVFLQFGMGSLD